MKRPLHATSFTVANFETRGLFTVATPARTWCLEVAVHYPSQYTAVAAQTDTGCLGVAVAVLLTICRRLNPAPFSCITTVPPAAVWPHAVATMSVGSPGNK